MSVLVITIDDQTFTTYNVDTIVFDLDGLLVLKLSFDVPREGYLTVSVPFEGTIMGKLVTVQRRKRQVRSDAKCI